MANGVLAAVEGGGLRFAGLALNAVDAKGRVSLPALFRSTIERRLGSVTVPDGIALPRAVMMGMHESWPALQGFDIVYLDTLHAQLKARVEASADPADQLAAFDDAQLDAFSAVEEVAFDGNGRMVLPAGLRRRSGIADLAFFVAAGDTFQIWHPDRFREHRADSRRAIDALDDLLADRAARGKGGAA